MLHGTSHDLSVAILQQRGSKQVHFWPQPAFGFELVSLWDSRVVALLHQLGLNLEPLPDALGRVRIIESS